MAMNLGDILDSASNIGAKGLAQYPTPPELARKLAGPLSDFRPAIIDLTCGAGNLLRAARTKDLTGGSGDSGERNFISASSASSCSNLPFLAGCEIDNSIHAPSYVNVVQADLTRFYPLLREVDFRADLFVLNPPFGLNWSADLLLPYLRDSRCLTVSECFKDKPRISQEAAEIAEKEKEPSSLLPLRPPVQSLDSAVATFAIALDLCSDIGEGYCIMNANTAHRLILDRVAPCHILAAHVWAVIEGPFFPDISVPVAVLYFSRGHTMGPQFERKDVAPDNLDAVLQACNHWLYQKGACMFEGFETRDTDRRWKAAAQEWQARQQANRTDWNLWLDKDGVVRTNLNLFQTIQLEKRINEPDPAGTHELLNSQTLKLLHSLSGRTPMQLVMQREKRRALEEAVGPNSPWRVQPELPAAVRQAVIAYHADRAPLYPLNAVQRLGYLDEADQIECKKQFEGLRVEELKSEDQSPREQFQSVLPIFFPGEKYAVETRTVQVRRPGRKRNLQGEWEDVEYAGSELVIKVASGRRDAGAPGSDHSLFFLDKTALADHVTLDDPKDEIEPHLCRPLEDLIEHFIIPPVPDVAELHPQQYQKNLEILCELERRLRL